MKFIHFLLYQRHKIYMLSCPWSCPNFSPLGKLFEYHYSLETFKDAARRNIVNANKGTNELVCCITCHGHKVADRISVAARILCNMKAGFMGSSLTPCYLYLWFQNI